MHFENGPSVEAETVTVFTSVNELKVPLRERAPFCDRLEGI